MSISWLSGPPCAGKTFLGDYLAAHHGCLHVDGDGVSYSKAPADERTWAAMLRAFGHWFRGEQAPAELWHPHYAAICAQAAQAAASGRRVVVTFAAMTAACRAFASAQLGARGWGVTWVWLAVSEEELVRRNLARLTAYLGAAGLSHSQYWQSDADPNIVAARAR